jgi:1-acyl-sn-glycerol-3-phosphate acyltransferase
MRSFVFNILFYTFTIFFALLCVLLSILPGRKPIMGGLWLYTRSMMLLMRYVAGIKIMVSGHERLPEKGPYIIAPKHQSYGDGFVMFSQFFDLSFVTGDHLEKFMTLKRILRKAGAVVVDSCGGSNTRDRLQKEAALVQKQGRRLLIYPEGHLSQIGTHHRYRKGVYYMYKDFGCPVVPVATNLGQRWNQNDWTKHAGPAQVEFLDPIMPGLGKDEFMQALQSAIETRSLELLDRENLGALKLDDIGQLRENSAAQKQRKERAEQET